MALSKFCSASSTKSRPVSLMCDARKESDMHAACPAAPRTHFDLLPLLKAADVDSVLETVRSLGLVAYVGAWLSPRQDAMKVITLLSAEVPEAKPDNCTSAAVARCSRCKRTGRRCIDQRFWFPLPLPDSLSHVQRLSVRRSRRRPTGKIGHAILRARLCSGQAPMFTTATRYIAGTSRGSEAPGADEEDEALPFRDRKLSHSVRRYARHPCAAA